MRCPKCGNPMNHHADKLVYVENSSGGECKEQMEEFYSCIACGWNEARAATS